MRRTADSGERISRGPLANCTACDQAESTCQHVGKRCPPWHDRLGGHLERFLSERNFRPRVRRDVFRPKSRVSPRCVTAGRTLERRHCLPGLHQHRVEVTAASALPSDLHRQLDDRRGDLRQCLNALCPEFRFGHGGLSRFGFERCHGSSGAVRTVCMLAGAAIVQSPVVRGCDDSASRRESRPDEIFGKDRLGQTDLSKV